mmetsp:Transcript_43232/g.108250  ORF Transcript_43232/g.108250 Transcript_43232/m.108250 type:complete len:202 (-) Transcript_43232:425-1030(-)
MSTTAKRLSTESTFTSSPRPFASTSPFTGIFCLGVASAMLRGCMLRGCSAQGKASALYQGGRQKPCTPSLVTTLSTSRRGGGLCIWRCRLAVHLCLSTPLGRMTHTTSSPTAYPAWCGSRRGSNGCLASPFRSSPTSYPSSATPPRSWANPSGSKRTSLPPTRRLMRCWANTSLSWRSSLTNTTMRAFPAARRTLSSSSHL